jgi:hypothetical protein
MINKDKTLIPWGYYCYNNGRSDKCPYWYFNKEMEQLYGYQGAGGCHYLETGDWEDNYASLLWDQVKECGENIYEEIVGCDTCTEINKDCFKCLEDVRKQIEKGELNGNKI